MADEGELIAKRYRVRTRIGQGAMGVVWRAEDERLRREVALKQVALPAGADEPARALAHRQVFREARMTARLHHPHAITVYDVIEHEGQPWLVMEYLPSRSLAHVIDTDGPLDPTRVAHVGRQVADALAAAHQAAIVHRDVKPGNVLLTDDDLSKVTDFGIARAVDDVTLSSNGMVAGTPAYLAPEVARGETADFRSDVYSLGSTLYAALEGRPPFGTGENPLAVLHRVASGQYAPLAHHGPITPLVEQLLRPEPEARPDLLQVRGALARLASAEAGIGEGPATPFVVRPIHTADAAPTPAPAAASPRTAPPPGPAATPAAAPATSVGSAARPATSSPDGHTGGAAASTRPTSRTAPPAASAPSPLTTAPGGATDGNNAPAADAPRGRRWPWVVAVALIVVAVAGFALMAVLSSTSDRPTASVQGNPAAPEPSEESEPARSVGNGSVSADGAGATDGTEGSAPLADGLEDQARQQAVFDYYALLPDQLDEGWQRLTPSFRQQTAGGFASYRGFWGRMQQVTVRGVSSAGGSEVAATVAYRFDDGREVDERTVFRLVLADGIWKIDGQRPAD